MSSCVIIPAHNEAAKIADVIRGAKEQNTDVVVIDDGSLDNTSEIAKAQGADVIRHDQRRGKGTSIRDGLHYCLPKGYDIVVTMDGDGQHKPDDLKRFIDRASDDNIQALIGNRMENPTGMPKIRIFSNWFMSVVISSICRQKIPDTQCGFRLFKREAIEGIDIRADKFEIESELLVKVARKGVQIDSISIDSIYAGEQSKIRPIRDTVRFFRFLIHIYIKKH
ncbi:glycosyltransferase family 2 protein [Candidatus Omnitrophota bacterium]